MIIFNIVEQLGVDHICEGFQFCVRDPTAPRFVHLAFAGSPSRLAVSWLTYCKCLHCGSERDLISHALILVKCLCSRYIYNIYIIFIFVLYNSKYTDFNGGVVDLPERSLLSECHWRFYDLLANVSQMLHLTSLSLSLSVCVCVCVWCVVVGYICSSVVMCKCVWCDVM